MPTDAGLYIHTPFCRRKCPYCSFYSRPPRPGDFERFAEAVSAHLRRAANSPRPCGPPPSGRGARHEAPGGARGARREAPRRFATIFFGGGTPTLLPTAILAGLLREMREYLLPSPHDAGAFAREWERPFRCPQQNAGAGGEGRETICASGNLFLLSQRGSPSPQPSPPLTRGRGSENQSAEEPEISIEANPGTVDAGTLAELRRAGFNRLSLGVQSFHDRELAALGRIHSAAEAREAVSCARRAGFDNINLDLMYGLPGQSPADWGANLEAALALAPEHLALYELTPEAPSPLFDAVERGEIRLPDEDAVLAMLEITRELTRLAGLERYEISNYARPGFECRHNVNYWENGEYLGLGPGAVSSIGGCRAAVPPDLARYHERALRGLDVYGERERLDREAAFRESVVMALRMIRGASAPTLRVRFGLDLRTYYGPTLERLAAQKLLAWRGDNLALTEEGLLLANRVMAELV